RLRARTDIVERPAGGRAEIVAQRLPLARQPVGAAMLPEAAEPGIAGQPRQQVVADGGDAVITAETGIERVGHASLPAMVPLRRTVSPAPGDGQSRRHCGCATGLCRLARPATDARGRP